MKWAPSKFRNALGLSILTISGQAFQAIQRLQWTATFNIALSVSRLSFAIIFLYALGHRHPTALDWGILYCSSTFLVAIIALATVLIKIEVPSFELPTLKSLHEGIYFAISLSAQTIYNDIDKSMLSKFSTLSATGIYGAAYRIIDVSLSPVVAFLYATYPEFFRKGSGGLEATAKFAGWAIKRSLLFSLSLAVLLIFCSGLAPLLLGREFSSTSTALRLLALILPLRTVHLFLSDSLTGCGHQNVRCLIQVGVALFNVLINLWLIPAYSWKGAVASSLVSDTLLLLAIYTAVRVIRNRQRSLPASM